MNKSAIQKYAIWARNELRDQIAKRGYYFGIDADGINVDGKDETCVYARDGRLLTDTERKQRNELFRLVKEKGFDQVVEEVSYTWFNRLIALRFMEVNDYLPDHIRVLSNANNEFKPEIKTRALDLEDPHFDKKKILDLIDKNDDEELYRYLLLTECNALNDILPQMFEKIGGYTELLLPNNLLKADSVIGKLVSDIDEADWDVKSEGGQVQIIGWLYQYYNQELKDQTFNDLKKKNKKISKERIPAATQLFTPDWIVHYMVENSLGRMWVEGHPNDQLKSTWKYYLDEAEQKPEVEEQLREIRKEYSKLNPQDIKFLDPAMGSGHILVVAFDILMQIYESQGIRPREAAKSILENNLYGLDIDDRAAQLAYFAVMMKAREYDRRIFSRGIQPNLFSIQESNGIGDDLIDYVADGDQKLYSDLKTLVKEMKDAKEYGSLITVSQLDFNRLEERLGSIKEDSNLLKEEAVAKIKPLVNVGKILSEKYEIICTNPPYESISNMDFKLSSFVKENYGHYKLDLFSAFIKKCCKLLNHHGLGSLITQQSWMFLSGFEKMRQDFLKAFCLRNMAHLGPRSFEDIAGEVVQSTAFVFSLDNIQDYLGVYLRLVDHQTCDSKRKGFLKKENNIYNIRQTDFKNIPGSPIDYFIPSQIIYAFANYTPLRELAPLKNGLSTTNNEKFLRRWFEVDYENIGFNQTRNSAQKNGLKWFPYNKGGNFRKWYGNQEYIVNWQFDGKEIKQAAQGASGGRIVSEDYYFKPSLSWSKVSTNQFVLRQFPPGFLFDVGGPSIFPSDALSGFILGIMNSKVKRLFLDMLYPTINYEMGQVGASPIKIENKSEIASLAQSCVSISKDEWDSYETSWDFKKHPLLPTDNSKPVMVKDIWDDWNKLTLERFYTIKNNEERINKLLITTYNVQSVMDENVSDEDITIRKADMESDIKSLISYSIGTLFGRYSVKKDGLVICSSKKNNSSLDAFCDFDNVIPIGDDEYFEDDLTNRFIQWISFVYGSKYLEENLAFIAKKLGGTGTPREVIRKYFINDFYADHCKMYKKRPIYWLFDSGKKNGFKCLIYMHRYTPDTLARIRTDYVHEQQERYRSQIKHIQETIDTVPKSDQVKMKKELKDLEAKSKEVVVFEEKLHHLADQMIEIDLDDGVKHNYALFQDVLAKIK